MKSRYKINHIVIQVHGISEVRESSAGSGSWIAGSSPAMTNRGVISGWSKPKGTPTEEEKDCHSAQGALRNDREHLSGLFKYPEGHANAEMLAHKP